MLCPECGDEVNVLTTYREDDTEDGPGELVTIYCCPSDARIGFQSGNAPYVGWYRPAYYQAEPA